MNSDPKPEWTYKCQGANKCKINYGSAKAIRIFNDDGVEKVVTVPGPRSALIILNANTGKEVIYIS